MKGAIIIPTFYKKRHAKGQKSMVSKILLSRIGKLCNFPLVYTDVPNLKGLDVALIYAVPYHNRPRMPPGLLNSSGTKLISYFGDLQCYDDKECAKNKKLMFKKCDVIMGGFYSLFMEWYSEYAHKYELSSGYCHPYENYANLQMNPKPEMKCLLSGSVNRNYPFRKYIKKLCLRNVDGISGLIDIKKRSFARFAEYPKFLNNYFCAIATSGAYKGIISKYFEIPAAGTLLLAEREKELDILGFKPYIHYVPITRENVVRQVKEVLRHPKEYAEIRKDGMECARKNHSDINRAQQVKTVVERIL